MDFSHKILRTRKLKGLTQEELADRASLTVRTIQRIESGETVPRAFTLKCIAAALDLNIHDLTTEPFENEPANSPQDLKHHLQLICLSCFSYLVIPFLHFLLPLFLLKKSSLNNSPVLPFVRKIIRIQLYWLVLLHGSLLVILAFNLLGVSYFNNSPLINYLWPVFIMYLLNAIIICNHLLQLKKMDLRPNY